jgi:hypothetical protein
MDVLILILRLRREPMEGLLMRPADLPLVSRLLEKQIAIVITETRT